jgi:hypothetical protein
VTAAGAAPARVLASSEVPVVECPTEHGIPGTRPAKLPDAISTSLLPADAARLAYYSDETQSLDPILAPRGWACRASEAVDGNATVVAAPSVSDLAELQNSNPTSVPAEAVTADGYPACQGCVYAAVCALVPGAGTQLAYPDLPCSTARPSAESVNWLNGSPTGSGTAINDVVGFRDPPGVSGDGRPSGGPNPANGVLRYLYGSGQGGRAGQETCTLPATEHQLCTDILNDFVQRAWYIGA